MKMSALPPWRVALLAVVSVATATVMMWALQEFLHHSFLVFFIAAVAITALAGGRLAAAFAIVLSMLAYPAVAVLSGGARFGFQQIEIEFVLLVTSGVIAWLAIRQQEARKRLAAVVLELQQALEEVRTLRGMIPICAACKKIRDDQGYWVALERYIQERTYARFTHGMCKECIMEYYPEVYPELFPNEEVPKGSRG
jgi:K+-sensing histidine kinase KdpD